MTPRAFAVAEQFRAAFAELKSLEPEDVDMIVHAAIEHLRCVRPLALSPVNELAPVRGRR
jgi:hypothetical protein